jgi:glycosyltransferase-like protein
MRIAILAHSTNPRGGVAHAAELGDALTRLGHDVAVHAPDPRGTGFGRPTVCRTVSVAANPAPDGLATLIRQRTDEYVRHFASPAAEGFDIFHAQDGISGNALLTLRRNGVIRTFARTVHHVDRFADPYVTETQQAGLRAADGLFVVSRHWQTWLADTYGREATLVGNGVDAARFTPIADVTDAPLRARLGIRAEDVVLLAIGGIEERKNTRRIIEAFAAVRGTNENIRLVIAGGASLLDHDAYRQSVLARLETLGLPAGAVVRTGSLPHADMPALYRLATALVFPSTREGFGLVILEAQASGVPVVTSAITPFTEFLDRDSVAWCDPNDVGTIAAAIRTTLDARQRPSLIAAGHRVASKFDWDAVARAHVPAYDRLSEHAHA